MFGKTKKTGNRKRRKKLTVIVLVLVLLAAAAAVVRLRSGGGALPVVEAVSVQRGDIVSKIDTSGTVRSMKEKTYFSPVNADIRTYDLTVGQTVEQGETLVTFETDTLEQDNQKAVFTASTTVNTNRDTVKKSEKTMQEAAAAKEKAEALEGDVDAQKAYIRSLNDAISDRTRELARTAEREAKRQAREQSKQLSGLNLALASALQRDSLAEDNVQLQAQIESLSVEVSRAEFDSDAATAAILQGQIDAREKRIEDNEAEISRLTDQMEDYGDLSAEEIRSQISALSTAGSLDPVQDPEADEQILRWQSELQEAESALADLQGDLAEEEAKASAGESAELTEAGRKAMESGSNMAELEAASAEALLQKGRQGIHADFPGIITRADLSPGAAATQGLELVTVASSQEVAVETTVSKYDYSSLEKGQKAEITIGSSTYRGHVSGISRVAGLNEKNAPVITCQVKIENPDDKVFLGVEAKVSITVGEAENVLCIPPEAVNTGKDGTFCYVAEEGRVARREIVTGLSSEAGAEVREGLQEGEQVLADLPEGVGEGMEVQIINSQNEHKISGIAP